MIMDFTNTRYTFTEWNKLGNIFNKCHCQIPTVISNKDFLRIYFSSRDHNNQSLIFNIDVEANDPTKVVNFDSVPLLPLDKEYDQHGTMSSCFVDDRLYYTGWCRTGSRYQHTICAAEKTKAGYEKIGPVIAATENNFFLCSSPFVLSGNPWKMWFISGEGCGGWCENTPLYTIRYAESNNGIEWEEKTVVFPRKEREIFARPFINITSDKYQMWYSKLVVEKEKRYTPGYAESNDGLNWTRLDELVGITVSTTGWDSEMVAFPFLYQHNDVTYLFYSGNGYGKSGIGCAIQRRRILRP